MRNFIPVCEPYFCGNEKKYLKECIDSGWISSSGKFIERFEKKFAKYCGVRYGITTTSGTTALHLALLAAGIKKGDEVIIPDFTMVSTLFAVLYCQARPVFVDVKEETGNIDISKIEEKITKKTKAIIPVHIYGHPVDIDPILRLAKKYNLCVVEDAAEAHGAEYKGKKCGGLGHLACFSFYANKIITCGEGGMVVTNNKKLASRCRYFKNLCFPLSGKRSYIHKNLGYNYRMTNVQAAIGLAQLEKIKELVRRRRKNAELYNKFLKNVPGLKLPVEKPYAKNVYWMYGIVVDPKKFGRTRNRLAKILKGKGIDSRNFFQPMHKQPVLTKMGIFDKNNYPTTEKLAKNGLYLPSGSGLTEKEIFYICKTIKRLI